MESRRFDQLTTVLARTGTRRGLLGLLATLPLLGGLLALFDLDELDAKGRRKRRKKRHKHGKGRRRKHRKKKCKSNSTATTCAGKCGRVTNNCQQAVDCGPCACDPPCAECFVCNETPRTCEADPLQVGAPCGSAGQVCQADGACACDAASCPDEASLCLDGSCRQCVIAETCPPPSGLCRAAVCTIDGQCDEQTTDGESCTRLDGIVARCFGPDCIPCSLNGGQCGPGRVCCAGDCLSGAYCALDGTCAQGDACCNPTGAPQNRLCCQRRNGIGDHLCCIRGRSSTDIISGQGSSAPCTLDSQCCSNFCLGGQCIDENSPSGCAA